MYRIDVSYEHFYTTLNEIWLYESDPNALSTCSEPGGKQWRINELFDASPPPPPPNTHTYKHTQTHARGK